MEDWREKVRFVKPTQAEPAVINPATGMEMERFEIGGVVIDRCPHTGSIWLDRGELGRINLFSKADRALLEEIDRAPESAARFPRSHRGMTRGPKSDSLLMIVRDDEQPHIEFEVCPVTGGCYFHAGELADLVDYSFVERLKTFFRR